MCPGGAFVTGMQQCERLSKNNKHVIPESCALADAADLWGARLGTTPHNAPPLFLHWPVLLVAAGECPVGGVSSTVG
mgnify:CR=1 FL=1